MSDSLTDRDLMQLVVGRSIRAQEHAMGALRAIAVGSPAVPIRLARTAEIALADPDADWPDDERAALAALLVRPIPQDAGTARGVQLVVDLLADSGLTLGELARVLGRDTRTVERWVSGAIDVPQSAVQLLERLRITDVTPRVVRLEVTR